MDHGGIADTDIAIIGMAGRFPRAGDPDELWRLVVEGGEGLTWLTASDLDTAGVPGDVRAQQGYVPVAGVLADVDAWDADFFGVGPRDAAIMDPQHRLFLECAWEALERAGHDPGRPVGPIGVFAGCGMNAYFVNNLLTNPSLVDSVGLFLLRHTGNDKDFLATEVSYKFDLRGPSVNVQTACSTSLVALHLAAQSLIAGECDVALAGGVTIDVPHGAGYHYREGEILSPDGHCRAFDARSAGTVLASGVGVVALRRLADALDDGDEVLAVVKGSAVNNDGSRKVSYLAPSVDGHAAVVAEALAVADVDARTITYLEAHGTGTAVGDPIEVAALTNAFRASTADKGYCAIGSTKPNIGHLDTAAGVASVIKVVQALRHRTVPPLANFSAPNPLIDFATSPFTVPTKAQPWELDGGPRRAGISSLGVGGTNAHVVIEEAPDRDASDDAPPTNLLVLSARTRSALDQATARLAAHLRTHPDANLGDVAYTLQLGRAAFGHRRSIMAATAADAVAALDRPAATTAVPPSGPPGVVLVFPGGGSQYPSMGHGLYERHAVYRDAVEEGLAALLAIGVDLRPVLRPGGAVGAEELRRPTVSLPAVLVTELALAALWRSWGVEPVAMVGHSLGEYTAAHLAGVMSLEDTLRLVLLRAELMERVGDGAAMLAVPLPESELTELLDDRLSLAAVNGPASCVVSGPADAIDELAAALEARGREGTRLALQAAAHSSLLDPVLDDFRAGLQDVTLNPPSVPLLSNLTGTWATDEELTDPERWVRHLRGTVRFADGLAEALAGGPRVVVELGPGQALSSAARQQPIPPVATIPTLRHPADGTDDDVFALAALGRLWEAGVPVDWAELHAGQRRHKVALPTYPFERSRHWIDPGTGRVAASPSTPALERARDLADWFSTPRWVATPIPAASSGAQTWLVLCDTPGGVGETLAAALRSRGETVATVRPGARFGRTDEGDYVVEPCAAGDFATMLADLDDRGHVPTRIVHTWLAGAPDDPDEVTRRGFSSLMALGKALGKIEDRPPLHLAVVSDRLQRLAGDERNVPAKATVLGPLLVLPREVPDLTCSSIDLPDAGADFLDQLVAELRAAPADALVAWRGGQRFVRQFERTPLGPAAVGPPEGWTWLVTGGLGALGLVFARHLAAVPDTRLVLLGRSSLPPEDDWDELLADPDTDAGVAHRIRCVRDLRRRGAEVVVAAADVTDRAAMCAMAADVTARFGRIDAVLHTAGVLDDGLVQFREPEESARILAPKVRGTEIVADVVPDAELLVLFGSTSALLGPPGQADYAAANAYLDAFAASRADGPMRVQTVDWGIWRGIGMSASTTGETSAPTPRTSGAPLDHPVLHELLAVGDRTLAVGTLSTEHSWVLDEHRLRDGWSVLPGSAHLELARAALTAREPGPVELRDVVFVAPLVVPEAEPQAVRVSLAESGDLAIDSAPAGTDPVGDPSWTGHVSALAEPLAGPAPVVDVAAARAEARTPSERDPLAAQREHLRLGSRWDVVRSVAVGPSVVVADLARATTPNDGERYDLDPALLDVALHVGLPLVQHDDALHVPFSVRRLRSWGPLPDEAVAIARLDTVATAAGVAVFDVVVTDRGGAVALEAEGFTVRRVDDPTVMTAAHDKTVRPYGAGETASASVPELVRLGAAAGISPEEGVEIFDRILAAAPRPQIVASSLDLTGLYQAVAPPASTPAVVLDRTSVGGTYAAASDEVEQELLTAWEELLGVSGIGVDDDFFELGGHSLIAVRLFARIRKLHDVELGLATLFEAPTVRTLAVVVRAQAGMAATVPVHGGWRCLVPIQRKGSRPPFFCIHGRYGNVVNFRDLAVRLREDQPFYGLQMFGLQEGDEPDPTIEAMAARYIDEMRTVWAGPWLLGGYSGGGLVALEMARQLTADGEDVAGLVLFDAFPPDATQWTTRQQLARLPARFRERGARSTVRWAKERTAGAVQVRRERLGRRLLGVGDPTPTAPEVFDAAMLAYELQPYDGDALLLRATERDHSMLAPSYPEDNGWGRWITGELTLAAVPGDHNRLFYEPNVAALADHLTAYLDARAATRA